MTSSKEKASGLIIVAGLWLALLAGCGDDRKSGAAAVFTPPTSNFCTATADLLFEACGFDASDDLFEARAKCVNVADSTGRDTCFENADLALIEKQMECAAQRDGRHDTCRFTGEERYDPQLDPADFETDYSALSNPNPYFPLAVGNSWEYEGGDEANTVTVLDETKLIEGITCVVVQDQVFEEGALVEDTDDWFCQATSGDVWYLGEEVKDYESFDGDDPQLPELVSIDGAFKHGRDGDKGGVIFPAEPAVGEYLTEEFSLGNAEDVTEILSTTYRFGSDADLDTGVPMALAALLCDDDCVVTRNFSLMEPGIEARKYYAAGIGFFLETDPGADAGEEIKAQLTDCSHDPRCDVLPPAP